MLSAVHSVIHTNLTEATPVRGIVSPRPNLEQEAWRTRRTDDACGLTKHRTEVESRERSRGQGEGPLLGPGCPSDLCPQLLTK